MPKNPNAIALGSLGGKARAANLSDQERKQGASNAISAYWSRMTPDERKAEAKRRAVVRKQNACPHNDFDEYFNRCADCGLEPKEETRWE